LHGHANGRGDKLNCKLTKQQRESNALLEVAVWRKKKKVLCNPKILTRNSIHSAQITFTREQETRIDSKHKGLEPYFR
jgi:hypothetical protein